MKKYLLFSIIGLAVFAFATTAMANTCPTGTTPTHVETVTVPSDGSSVTSTNVLESGATYLLEASGTYIYWPSCPEFAPCTADAKHSHRPSTSYGPGWISGDALPSPWTNYLEILIDSTPVAWGVYNDDHVYTITHTGTGNTVGFNMLDSGYGDNSGSLTVDIDKCVDVTAPVVTIESPTDGNFVDGTVDIYGTIVEDYELSHYNISVYPGDVDFMDFSKRLEQETVYLSSSFDNQLIYQWDTTVYDDGEYLIRLAARDKAGNRDISGDPYSGGDDSQHVITVIVDNDFDGVYDDMCPGTNVDLPTKELGTNRWIWNGQDWISGEIPGKGKAKGPDFDVTMEDTQGCGCFQILEWLNTNYPEEYGEMEGHYKHGCSIGIMQDFMALTSQE